MNDAAEKKDVLYKNIGKFIVHFEEMCYQIRTCIWWAFHRGGLKKQKLIHTMMAELTADPLIKQLLTISHQIYGGESSHYKVISELLKKAEKMNEKRNKIAHGHWMMAADSEYERLKMDVVVDFQKNKKTGKGLGYSQLKLTPEEFEKLNSDLIALNRQLNGLSICISREGLDKIKDFDLTKYE